MGFFEEKMQVAETQTEKLIADYSLALNSHQDASSLKTMVSAGAPATSIADRAFVLHQGLFKALMSNANAPQVLKSKQRVQIIEQFCLAVVGNMIGNGPYQLLLKKFNFKAPKNG